MAKKHRPGLRRHYASFAQHNGLQHESGNPTLDIPNHWDLIIPDWPCEVLTTGGDEVIRGRQVTATTSHVLIGDYYGAQGAVPDMRVTLEDGTVLNLVAAIDPDGQSEVMRVECKSEQ